MKRKFLLTMMILSLFTIMGAGHLCAQTEVEVSTFTELKSALENGGNIKLMANINASEKLMIGKNVTLNGNMKTITSTAQKVLTITESGVTVEIRDLSLISNAVMNTTDGNRGFNIEPSANNVNLTLNNCSVDFNENIEHDWAYAVNGAGQQSTGRVITINSGTYEGANVVNVWGKNHIVNIDGATLNCRYKASHNYYGTCVRLDESAEDDQLTVKNTVFNGDNAVAFSSVNDAVVPVLENNTDNTRYYVARIGESYYYSLSAAVAAATNGQTVTLLNDIVLTERINVAGKNIELNLNECSITADFVDDYGAIYVKKGAELTIKGDGNITSTGTAIGTYGEVNIKGGNITAAEGYAALYMFYYQPDFEGTAIITGGELNTVWNCGFLTINGGKIDYLDTSSELTIAATVENNSITKMIAKDGSDASGEYLMHIGNINAIDQEIELLEGFVMVEVENGVYKVVQAEAVIGTTYYATLQAAFDAAQDGDVITLLDNVETDTYISLNDNKNVTLDILNYNISKDDNKWVLSAECENASLTIVSSAQEKGTIHGAVYIGTGATITLNDANIELCCNNNYAAIYNDGGNFVMNSGYVHGLDDENDNNAVFAIRTLNGGTSTINGGTIESDDDIYNNGSEADAVYAVFASKGSTVVINNNPTIKGASGAIAAVSGSNVVINGKPELLAEGSRFYAVFVNGTPYEGKTASATIYDGKYIGATKAVFANYNGMIEIYGGTFSSDASQYCAPGLTMQQNAEGNWVVVEDPASEGKEAVIGTTYYETLEAAVAAATSGQTVTLLQNAEIEVEAGLLIDKNLTVDLNNKEITNTCANGEGDVFRIVSVESPTTFTVKKGTLNSQDIAIYSAGNGNDVNTVVVENVEINSDYFGIYHNGSKYGANIIVRNSAITDTYGVGIFLSGSESWNNAKDAKLNSLSIENSTIKGGRTAVEVKYGNITITDSELIATSEEQNVVNNGNGSCTTGYALALTNNTNGSTTTSTVGSITLNGENTLTGGVIVKAEGEVNVTTNSPDLIPAPEGYYWNEGVLTPIEDTEAEAVIGTTYYETLELAIEAAQTDDEIVILKDVTRSNIVVLDKAVTLNGNYKTLTSTMSGTSGRALNVNVEGDVTVKNLTINASGERGINVIQKPANLTIENVTVTAANYAVNLATSASSGENGPIVQINNSEFTGLNTINIAAPYTTMNIDGIVLTCNDQNPNEYYGAISIEIHGSHSVVYVTNYDFTVLDDSEWAQVSAEDSYVHFDPSQEVQYDNVAVYAYEGANYYYSYPTLKEAIESSKTADGAYIKLVNSWQGSGIVINKSVTIDFNGKTYSFTTPAVGSQGTISQGLQILKENNVTLKNGTLNVHPDNRTEYAMLIQNYANLTITDMTLDGAYLDRYTIKDYNYSYVISNNCGVVNINGETNIFANNDENHYGVAFDVCKYADYEAPVVTVNTTGTIQGVVEVSAILNLEAIGSNNISNVVISGEGQLYHDVEGIQGTMVETFENDNDGNPENDWYTLSVPFSHSVAKLQTESDYALYRYNEGAALWENVKVTENNFTTLDLGRGYIYANAQTTEVEFEGELNVKPVTYQLTASSETNLKGFHLVGNPFTHEITMSNLTTEAILASGFYVLENDGAWVSKTEGDKIAKGQAALIKTTSEGELTIVKNVDSKSRAVNNGQLKINIANSEYNDVAYVSFNEGVGLDKISHRNAEVPMVYVPVNGENYAVAMMNKEVTEIPVSFEAMSLGQYTFSVEAQDCEFSRMYLYDRFTGETTNLLLEDYTFLAKSGDNAERFIIKLAFADDNAEGIENFALIYNGELIINNIDGEGIVRIYDVLGRPVAEYNVFGSANISTTTLRSGVYMIQMNDNNGVKVQKVIVD